MTKLLSEADRRKLADLEALLKKADADLIAADLRRKLIVSQIAEIKGYPTNLWLRRVGCRDRDSLAQLNCS